MTDDPPTGMSGDDPPVRRKRLWVIVAGEKGCG